MQAGNLKSYLLGSRMRESTNAMDTQGYIEHASLYIIEYTQEDKGTRAAWH